MKDSLSRWERAGVRDLDGKETANNFRGSAYCRPLPNPLPEGEGTYFMKSSRLNARMILLLLSEAMLLFGGLILAVYVRLGALDAEDALIQHRGFYKAALATIFCLAAFYLLDLYDFVVLHDRRELVLRLLQALGLAWVALAVVIALSPLGLLASGGAWGEWSAGEVAQRAGYLPSGMARVEAHGWKGLPLLPDYLSDRGAFGYLSAALSGAALALAAVLAITWFIRCRRVDGAPSRARKRKARAAAPRSGIRSATPSEFLFPEVEFALAFRRRCNQIDDEVRNDRDALCRERSYRSCRA